MAAAEVAQGLDRDIDANLVAVFETVSDRLGARVQADVDPLDPVGLDAFREGRAREARHSQPRVVKPRLAGFLGQRDPHLSRSLRRQLVEAQRREQADHTARDPLRDLGEGVLGGVGMIARGVDPTSVTLDLAFTDEVVHPPARDTVRLEVGRPDDPEPADDL